MEDAGRACAMASVIADPQDCIWALLLAERRPSRASVPKVFWIYFATGEEGSGSGGG